jgi:hypothetical protein
MIVLSVVSKAQVPANAPIGVPFEVGYSKFKEAPVKFDKATKQIEVVSVVEQGISAGKNLKSGKVSLDDKAEIIDLLEQSISIYRDQKKIPLENMRVYFSSSWEKIGEDAQKKISDRIKKDVGIDVVFTTSYAEGKSVAATTIPKDFRTSSMCLYIGSSSGKGGLYTINPASGRLVYTSFITNYGISKLKDSVSTSLTFEVDIKAIAEDAITKDIQASINQSPVLATRDRMYLCGDGPSVVATLLGAGNNVKDFNLSLAQVLKVREKIKSNPSELFGWKQLQESGTDVKSVLASTYYIETVMRQFPNVKTYIVDLTERTFVVGMFADEMFRQ